MFKPIIFVVLGANLIVLVLSLSNSPCTSKGQGGACTGNSNKNDGDDTSFKTTGGCRSETGSGNACTNNCDSKNDDDDDEDDDDDDDDDSEAKCAGCSVNCKDSCTCKSGNGCKYIGENDNNGNTSKNTSQRILDTNTLISGIFLYQKYQTNKGQNIIVSVFQLLWYLITLAFYATGSTRQEILCLFNITSTSLHEMQIVFDEFFELINVDNATKVSSIVYMDKIEPFSKNFTQTFQNIFRSQTDYVNYCEPTEAVKIINTWLRKETRQPCADLITLDDINENTGLTFVGMSSFNGVFKENFRIIKPVEIDFHVSKNKTIKSPAYYCEGTVKQATIENLGAEMIEIPMETKYSLVLIWSDDIEDLVFRLQSPPVLSNVFSKGIWSHTRLIMPISLNSRGSDNFVQGIKLSGYVPNIFDPEYNGFHGIFKNHTKSGYVSNMKHEIHFSLRNAPVKRMTTTKPVNRSDDHANDPIKKINRPYVYYVIGAKRSPVMSGIWNNNV